MRRSRRIGIGAAALLPIAVLACNALNGASDLSVSPPCDGCTDGEVDGTVRGSEGSVDADGGGMVDGPVDAPARPGYCEGIVMYARFDGALITAQGIAPEMPPAVTFVPGRFGTAALLSGQNGALYYVQGPGGVPYPRSEGTIAMWIKASWAFPPTVTRIFWKAVIDRTLNTSNASGPYMLADPSAPTFLGTRNIEPDSGAPRMAGSPLTALAPYWSADWNHLVETWSQSTPTLSFTLNGATGDPTSTRQETDAGWTPANASAAYVRLSSNSSPSESAYDDVALWNRSLSLAEIQAVYAAGTPIGDRCGL